MGYNCKYTCVKVIYPDRNAGGWPDTGVRGQRNREVNWLCDLNLTAVPIKQLSTDCSDHCQICPTVLSTYVNMHTLFTLNSLSANVFFILTNYSDNINHSIWYMTCNVRLQGQKVGEVIDFTHISGSGQNRRHFWKGGVRLQAPPWNVQPRLAPPSCVIKSGLLFHLSDKW